MLGSKYWTFQSPLVDIAKVFLSILTLVSLFIDQIKKLILAK